MLSSIVPRKYTGPAAGTGQEILHITADKRLAPLCPLNTGHRARAGSRVKMRGWLGAFSLSLPVFKCLIIKRLYAIKAFIEETRFHWSQRRDDVVINVPELAHGHVEMVIISDRGRWISESEVALPGNLNCPQLIDGLCNQVRWSLRRRGRSNRIEQGSTKVTKQIRGIRQSACEVSLRCIARKVRSNGQNA